MWTGIELLFPLQDFRLANPIVETLFVILSSRVFYLVLPILLATLFYWYVDKKQGEILAMGFVSSIVFSMCVKFGIAQPRPWQLDPGLIEPPHGSNSGGYALPSGHTASVTSSLLPAALMARERMLSAALIVLTVLIVIGRLVLCAHTPLDVLAGITVGLAAVAIAWKVTDLTYDDDRRYILANVAYAAVFTVLFVVTLTVWEGDVSDTLGYAGFMYGLVAARIMDRLYLGYEVPDTTARKAAVGYVQGMIAGALILLVPYYLIPTVGMMIGGMLMMLWGFFAYPALLSIHACAR